MTYTCPVCGYDDLSDPPHTVSGGSSYEICPSCGFEYGYTDDNSGYTFEAWRQKWIDEGMPWDEGETAPPAGWDPVEQLKNLDRLNPTGYERPRDR